MLHELPRLPPIAQRYAFTLRRRASIGRQPIQITGKAEPLDLRRVNQLVDAVDLSFALVNHKQDKPQRGLDTIKVDAIKEALFAGVAQLKRDAFVTAQMLIVDVEVAPS